MIVFIYDILMIALFGFVFPLTFIFFVFFYIVGDLMGGPYVPTRKNRLKAILEAANLKPGMKLMELGSGDGRLVREAVKTYRVKGWGIEVHPMLTWYARLLTRMHNLSGARFIRGNIFKINLSKFEVIFVFLLPKTMRKLSVKFKKECQKGTLIISHGFKLPEFEKNLIKTLHHSPFPTYYYKV